MAKQKHTAKKLLSEQTKTNVCRLRLAGVSFKDIGEKFGFSDVYAFQIVKAEFDRLRKERVHDIEMLRDHEAERLDAMQAGLWRKATAGDVGSVLGVIKIMERRAKMFGLDSKQAQTDIPITFQIGIGNAPQLNHTVDVTASQIIRSPDRGEVEAIEAALLDPHIQTVEDFHQFRGRSSE